MTIRLRRGTAALWAARNPVLQQGEPGYDSTNGTLKVGDGVTAWNALATIGGSGGAGTLPNAINPPATPFRMPITPGRSSLVPSLALNHTYFMPLTVATNRTLVELAVEVRGAAAAGGLLTCDLVSSTTGWLPNLEIASYGTVASDTTGVKAWTMSQALTTAAPYWVGICATVSAPAVVAIDAFNPFVAINGPRTGTTAFGSYVMNATLPLGVTPFSYFDVDLAIVVTAAFN